MKKQKVTPTQSLDRMLMTLLIIMIIGLSAGSYFAYTNLKTSADSANNAIIDLQKENAPLQNTSRIEEQNKKFADILQITPKLTIPASNFQATVTNDINTYARLTGIRISSTNYNKTSDGNPNNPNPTPTGSAKNQADSSPSQPDNITIQAANSVPMESILQFIKLIEHNLPVMYITQVSLEGTGGNSVKLNSLTIGVATQ